MTASGKPLEIPTAACNISPVVHDVYSSSTDTWQYVIADATTLHCIVLDPVRDGCADPAAMSTGAADAIIAVIKDRGYIVDYILETHCTSLQCLSAAWYLRMQLSMHQEHAPQLCNDATLSGLELMWKRKYGAGSSFSTTIRAGLDDGETIPFGQFSLTCMHMPGFGTPYRRAYLVGNELFGAYSIATLREDVTHSRFENVAVDGKKDPSEASSHHREAWSSMQRILSLPGDARVWRDQGDGSPSPVDRPFDSVAQCAALNKHANSTEEDFLTDLRVKSTLWQLAQSDESTGSGWKSRLGAWLSL